MLTSLSVILPYGPRGCFSLPSEGNLLLLNEALAKHETFFIRCGIFLILEKLKIITYRNLFKKVCVPGALSEQNAVCKLVGWCWSPEPMSKLEGHIGHLRCKSSRDKESLFQQGGRTARTG